MCQRTSCGIPAHSCPFSVLRVFLFKYGRMLNDPKFCTDWWLCENLSNFCIDVAYHINWFLCVESSLYPRRKTCAQSWHMIFFNIKKVFKITFACLFIVFVCALCTHMGHAVQVGVRQLAGLLLSCHVWPRGWTQPVRLGSQCLYQFTLSPA